MLRAENQWHVARLAIKVEIGGVPAFFREVSEPRHFNALGVVGVSVDFEVAGLGAIFGTGIDFKRELAATQWQCEAAIYIKMVGVLCRIRQVKADGTLAGVLQMHPRGNWSAGLFVDNFDFKLPVGARRCVQMMPRVKR
jgi:hypothetical protein